MRKMLAKCLSNEPFKAISSDSVAPFFGHSDPKTGPVSKQIFDGNRFPVKALAAEKAAVLTPL